MLAVHDFSKILAVSRPMTHVSHGWSMAAVKAYNAHALVLSHAIKEEILSLHKVRKLALDIAGLTTSFVDMCPKSCMAYTGDFESNTFCTQSKKGKVCNEPPYQPQQGSSRAKPKPRAKMLHIPIMPIIQAYYASDATSHQMCHRDYCLKESLETLAIGAGVKSPNFLTPVFMHTTIRKWGYLQLKQM